jgi:AcrR family transcriptional regulator
VARSAKIAAIPAVPRRSERKPKLTRSERNEEVRQRLFEAAAKVVGQHGYAEASVSRITALAGYAQGTFYNHFASRQELLDQLLPAMGIQMIRFIRDRVEVAGTEAEKEQERFRAFFDFLELVPEFPRILNEAEFFAPTAYQQHLENVSTAYVRLLRRARDEGGLGDFTDDELEVVVHILMGARSYLSRRRVTPGGAVLPVPDHVISAYRKLVTQGLFPSGPNDGGEP